MPVFHVRDACAAYTKCNRLLLREPPRAEEAWQVIEPYVFCTGIHGQFPLGNETLLQMLLAAAADAQFELNHPAEAAFLYKEALSHKGPCGFASRYAKLVIQHNLPDHVPAALDAIERADSNWRKRPRPVRWLLTAMWFMVFVVRHPRLWREYREDERHKEELRRLGAIEPASHLKG